MSAAAEPQAGEAQRAERVRPDGEPRAFRAEHG